MDRTYINPFIRSAECVFETMLQMPLECGVPTVKSEARVPHEVSAFIRFSGDVEGVAVLSLPEAIAGRIVTLLGGSEVTSREDLSDGVGEILNMIAGGAKARFGCREVVISCPSVVIGAGRALEGCGDKPTVVVPASCDCGQFVIEISVRASEPVTAA